MLVLQVFHMFVSSNEYPNMGWFFFFEQAKIWVDFDLLSRLWVRSLYFIDGKKINWNKKIYYISYTCSTIFFTVINYRNNNKNFISNTYQLKLKKKLKILRWQIELNYCIITFIINQKEIIVLYKFYIVKTIYIQFFFY
jgi:hypothetical protein